MAIFHMSVQMIKRSDGRSSVAAAAYRSATKIKDERLGISHNYSKKSAVSHSMIMAPSNSPEWVSDRAKLWNEVESAERRGDAQLSREVEVSLPKELSLEQMVKLAKDFADEQFVQSGMVADLNFHDLESGNPHCHMMLTTRDLGPDGFGKKNREWNRKELLCQWREKWADHVNRALAENNHNMTVSHLSNDELGSPFIPTIHHGNKPIRIAKNEKIRERNDGIKAIVVDLGRTHEQIRLAQQKVDRVKRGGAIAKRNADIFVNSNQLDLLFNAEANALDDVKRIRKALKDMPERRDDLLAAAKMDLKGSGVAKRIKASKRGMKKAMAEIKQLESLPWYQPRKWFSGGRRKVLEEWLVKQRMKHAEYTNDYESMRSAKRAAISAYKALPDQYQALKNDLLYQTGMYRGFKLEADKIRHDREQKAIAAEQAQRLVEQDRKRLEFDDDQGESDRPSKPGLPRLG